MADNIPRHIGLILDGNRRWAKQQGLPALEGHRRGYDNLKTILDAALDRGVRYVSAYIFSTENWNRTHEEVNYLMDLAYIMVTRELKGIQKRGVRIMWLGSEEKVSGKLKKAIRKAEEDTKNNTKGVLALCFNYGGQRELAEGIRRMVTDGIEPEEINEDTIAKCLYYPEIPPVDLVIRTSGEQRLSNFMLWRAAYSELYFIDKHWPDFTAADLDEALKIYAQRRRRFGG